MNLYEGVAKYYDIEESEYQQEDMDFYIEYAQKCKGNILELGCGTGVNAGGNHSGRGSNCGNSENGRKLVTENHQ